MTIGEDTWLAEVRLDHSPHAWYWPAGDILPYPVKARSPSLVD